MKIRFEGHEFELGNEIAMHAASQSRAQQMIAQAPVKDRDAIFEAFLTEIVGYWLKTGATVTAAHAHGAAGISINQMVELHNYIGDLIGEPRLQMVAVPANDPQIVDADGDVIPGRPPTALGEGD